MCVKQDNFSKGSCSTPGSTNFEGSKHANLGKIAGRAYVRGGRDHFTERKIDQIRGRLGKFGDLLTEIMRFQGF